MSLSGLRKIAFQFQLPYCGKVEIKKNGLKQKETFHTWSTEELFLKKFTNSRNSSVVIFLF